MRRRGLNIRKWFLRFVMPLLRRSPPSAATRFVTGIGRVEYALLSKVRVRFDVAVERAEKQLGGHWNVPEVGATGRQSNPLAPRDLLLDGLPDRVVAPLFDVIGRDHLDSALAEKQGVILLGNHFGAHVAGALASKKSLSLTVVHGTPSTRVSILDPIFRDQRAAGTRQTLHLAQGRSRRGRSVDHARARILKAGMIVKLAADVRWSGPHTTAVKFLDHTYTFSSTWVALASFSGAPIVPVFCRMDAQGRYRLEFLPSFRIPAADAAPEATARRVRDYLLAVEDRVRVDPANSNDYFFWADGSLEYSTLVGENPGEGSEGRVG